MTILRLLCACSLALALSGCDGEPVADAGVDSGADAGEVVGDAGETTDAGERLDAATSDGGAVEPGGSFIVDFDTTAGPIAVEVHPDWAPLGAARLRELVEAGYYDESKFFRVVPDFIAQFGLAADPAVTAMWRGMPIDDDPVLESNTRGTVTFATSGPDTRTTQLFINYGDNAFLDAMGFAPVGRVVEGMENADAINAEYGESPQQSRIVAEGNAYLDASFPNLTAIRSATIR